MRSRSLTAPVRALMLVIGLAAACTHSRPIARTSVSDQNREMQPKGDPVVVGPTVPPDGRSGTPQIRIRCGNTISADHPPLYVIDGVPAGLRSDGTIDHDEAAKVLLRLDSDSIASIEVLKEASAVARFGSGAHQGVVIIETKRGAARKK